LRRQYAALSDISWRAYLQVAQWLEACFHQRSLFRHSATTSTPLLIGISGAQGCGKSTLVSFLQQYLPAQFERRCVALSLDDFYCTRAQRRQLAADVHPLLATRGVPGSHDLALLNQTLDGLLQAKSEQYRLLPVFDKLADERLPENGWRCWQGRADIILLEGWCVGAAAEDKAALLEPINRLEREQDREGQWRQWVNQQLQQPYKALFERLDALIFMQVPDMAQVLRWRSQQEVELGLSSGQKGMSAAAMEQFVMHYERITRAMLQTLPQHADLLLTLNNQHSIVGIHERKPDKH